MEANKRTITKQTEDAVSPHHEHRVKEALRREAMDRKADILEEYYTLTRDKHSLGGKIVHHVKTNIGVTRSYVGREKQHPEFVAKIKKEGKLRVE